MAFHYPFMMLELHTHEMIGISITGQVQTQKAHNNIFAAESVSEFNYIDCNSLVFQFKPMQF